MGTVVAKKCLPLPHMDCKSGDISESVERNRIYFTNLLVILSKEKTIFRLVVVNLILQLKLKSRVKVNFFLLCSPLNPIAKWVLVECIYPIKSVMVRIII